MTAPPRGLAAPLLAGLAALLLASAAAAAPLAAGSPAPVLELSDQHDQPVRIDAGVRRIVLTRDMDGGDLVKKTLADDGAARLAAAGAVVVSDISRMPGFVTTMFALPALRKRGYPVVLDRDGKATADFPSQEGRVTVVETDGTVVTAIRVAGSVEELSAALAPR